MNLTIRAANMGDIATLIKHDTHVAENLIIEKISRKEFYVVYDDKNFIGWLRFGYFWDLIPFMNMLELLPQYRGKGIGRRLVTFWEAEMKTQDHAQVMTSTQQNEHAQHFYNALGYVTVGGFVQSLGAVTQDAYEVILVKKLS